MTDLLAPGAQLERLFTGAEWAEGPVWLPDVAALRFSDVVGDRVLQYDAASGSTAVHAARAEFANGRTLDLAGRVVQCSHGRRRVEREIDGRLESIVDRFDGRRLHSPNDVVVASDGTIWFTDPPYGLHASGREGHPGEREYDGCFVFRFDETTGELTPVITDMVHPNGLAFSPDERVLYVADTGVYGPDHGDAAGEAHIVAWDVADGRCANPRIVADPDVADGFRVDAEGRIWSSSREGVVVLAPDGAVLARIPVPEVVSNVAFGGAAGDELYITASSSLYRIRTATTGAGRPGARS